jgi:hypothetical protein
MPDGTLAHGADGDFARLIGPVARQLLGEPNPAHSSRGNLRWGTNGSMSVDLVKGVWHDHESGEGGGTIRLIEVRARTDKAGALAWLRRNGHLKDPADTPRPQVVATYDYTDEDGAVLFQVQRFAPKSFRQRRPEGTGWTYKLGDVRRVLYRLPELLEAVDEGRTIYVVEGEKSADRLAGIGLAATCSPGGAGKWRNEYNTPLTGAHVIVLPDNDTPGQMHAEKVAASLAIVAESVHVVPLPGLAHKGDVFDYLAARTGTHAELRAELEAVVAEVIAAGPAKVVTPSAAETGAPQKIAPRIMKAGKLAAMTFDPIKFVVPGYIAEGATLLAGRPKLGKSWLALDMALAVASGGVCLGGVRCEEGDVLYLALEDNWRRLQSRIKRIWEAEDPHAAIPDRLNLATEWPRADDGGVEAIRDWIAATPGARLVIVDVLAMFRATSRGRDQSAYDGDYMAIKSLQSLAMETGVAIVIVHHTRKSGGEADPFEKVSGTLGLSGAADTTIILDRDGNGATLYGRGRDIEEVETAVEFDRMSCRWRALGDAVEVRRTDERGVILRTLLDNTEPMSPAEIADAIGQPRNNTRQLIFKMMKAGEVVRVGGKSLYTHPDLARYQGDIQTPVNPDNGYTGDGVGGSFVLGGHPAGYRGFRGYRG